MVPVHAEQANRKMTGQKEIRRELRLASESYFPLGGWWVGALWYRGSGVQVPSIAPFLHLRKVATWRPSPSNFCTGHVDRNDHALGFARLRCPRGNPLLR